MWELPKVEVNIEIKSIGEIPKVWVVINQVNWIDTLTWKLMPEWPKV